MVVDRLPGIIGTRQKKLGPVDNEAVRKTVKKSNLSDAKSHFPHKVTVSNLRCSTKEAQQWLMSKHYRSWKQKGLSGDYYYDNWSELWFADKLVATEFILSLS